MFTRRLFLAHSAAVLGTGMLSRASMAADSHRRQFTMDLRCGSIGVKADQREAIRLAAKYGFESVNPDPGFLGRLSSGQRIELVDELKDKGLVWGAAGLPVEFRKDDSSFRADVQKLPELAAAMREAGVVRVGTWLRPSHAELTYLTNFRQHVARLRQIASILADHGQRFGLEYVGPKTSWSAGLHPFIHTMAETKELIAEIGLGNMGFVLDSWHWYTAHETVDDLRSLTNRDVVACDLNDAPQGMEIDEQIDNQRELPTATGVINLGAFLGALVEMGYDGPIRAEPFNKTLNQMDNEQAVAATGKAMNKAFALING